MSELGHFLLKWLTKALNGREQLFTLSKIFQIVFPFSICHYMQFQRQQMALSHDRVSMEGLATSRFNDFSQNLPV